MNNKNKKILYCIIAGCTAITIGQCLHTFSDRLTWRSILMLIINLFINWSSAIYVNHKCVRACEEGQDLYRETKSQQVLLAIPGICTSWGVFFTFAAIVITLGLLNLFGSEEDFSIFSITGSIIPAFSTSVIGMWYSMKSSEEARQIIAEEESRELVKYGNPAEDLHEILNGLQEIKKHQEQQSNSLQNFVSSFTAEFNKYFDSAHTAFERQMQDFTMGEVKKQADTLSNVGEKLKDVSEKVLQSQQDSVNKFRKEILQHLENSSEAMNSSLQENVRMTEAKISESSAALSTALGEVVKEIQGLTAECKNLVKTLQTQQKDATEKAIEEQRTALSKFTTELTTNLEKSTSDISTTLTSSSDKAVANLTSLTEKIATNLSSIRDSQIEETNKLVESQKNAIESTQKQTCDSLQESVRSVTSTISELSEGIQTRLSNLTSKITDASLAPLEVLKKEIEFISERVGEICHQYENAASAYSSAVQDVHAANETWGRVLDANEQTLKHVETTNEGVGEIIDVLQNRHEGLQQISTEINCLVATVTKLQELNSILLKLADK